jgi:chemotaxis response regulator CheB
VSKLTASNSKDTKQQKEASQGLLSSDLLFPIVGIGQSAATSEAITQFLLYVSVKSGIAFVNIQHLGTTLFGPDGEKKHNQYDRSRYCAIKSIT